MLQKWWAPGQLTLLHCGAAIHGVAKRETRLTEQQMATHTLLSMFHRKMSSCFFLREKLFQVELFCCCSLSRVRLSVTPWTAARQPSLSFTISRNLLRLMSIESVMPSNHCILCHPLLLLPSIFPSIRVFFSDSALRIRWPKYWSFSFSISPSNEYSGLISFRMDWFDLLAVQGAFKSLLQHHSSKHQYCSALTSVHDYWKTIALTIQTFVGKVVSLVF